MSDKYCRGNRRPGLRVDEHARVPFAFVAVLIMLLAGYSWAYLSAVNNDYVLSKIENQEIRKMESMSESIRSEITCHAYYQALEAIRQITQNKPWMEEDINDRFCRMDSGNFDNYIRMNFPRRNGEYDIVIEDYSAKIFVENKLINDLAADVRTSNDGSSIYKSLNTTMGKIFKETSCMAYYTVLGNINITITKRDGSHEFRKTITFDRDLKCPYPFLDTKFKVLEANSDGDMTEIARMVKYMLTTIAQYRVFQGYGMNNIIGIEVPGQIPGVNEKGPMMKDVLTKSDVEIAVNLALQLEIARIYRNYDKDAITEFDKLGSAEDMGYLFDSYVDNGTIDAADLISIYIGLGQDKIAGMNLEAIFAQSMNSITDQFILKFLDYFGFVDNTDDLFLGAQFIQQYWNVTQQTENDFFGWLLGNTDGSNVEIELTERIIENILDFANQDPYFLDVGSDVNGIDKTQDRDAFSYDIDISNQTYECNFVAIDEDEFVQGTYTDNYDTDGNHTNGTEEVRIVNYTDYYNANKYNVKIIIKPILNYPVIFPHQDITNNDDVWSPFFDSEKISMGNNMYQNLRSAVEKVITNITNMIIDDTPNTIAQFRTIEIDPKDNSAILEQVRAQMTRVIEEIISYYISDEGKNTIKDIIDKTLLIDEGFSEIQNIAKDILIWMTDHYDELVNCDETPDYSSTVSNHPKVRAARSLAEMLVQEVINDYSKADISITSEEIQVNWEDPPTDTMEIDLPIQNHGEHHWKGTGLPTNSEITQSSLNILYHDIYWDLNNPESYNTAFLSHSNSHIDDVMLPLQNYIEQAYEDIKNYETGNPNWVVRTAITEVVEGEFDHISYDGRRSITSQILDCFIDGSLSISPNNGLIPSACEFVRVTCKDVMKSDKFANTKFIQEIQVKDNDRIPFTLKDNNSDGTPDIEYIIIDQTPDWLSENDGLSEISIKEPFGTHYTNDVDFTKRSFQTQWNVVVKGDFNLSTATESNIFLSNGTHTGIRRNGTVVLDMRLPITVYSGWELDGIDYDLTYSYLKDFMELLDDKWDRICELEGWILDGVLKLVEQLEAFSDKLIDDGALLANAMSSTFEILFDSMQIAINDWNLGTELMDSFKGQTQAHWQSSYSAFGYHLSVSAFKDSYVDIWIHHGSGALAIRTKMQKDQIQLRIEMEDAEFDLVLELDTTQPYTSISGTEMGSPCRLKGSYGDSRIDLTSGSSENVFISEVSSPGVKIEMPDGLMTVKSGISIEINENIGNGKANMDEFMTEIIGRSVDDAFGIKKDMSIQNLIDAEVSMLQSMWEKDICGEVERIFTDVSENMELELFFDVEGLDGTGCRIGLILTDPVKTIPEIYSTLINNIPFFINDMASNIQKYMNGQLDISQYLILDLPEEVYDNIFIRVLKDRGSGQTGSHSMISMNLEKIMDLTGYDTGKEMIELGVCDFINPGSGRSFELTEINWSLNGRIKSY